MFTYENENNDNELNENQKIKLFTTLSEFILLNINEKPKIFTQSGEENKNIIRPEKLQNSVSRGFDNKYQQVF